MLFSKRQKFIFLALLLSILSAALAYFLPEYKTYSMLVLPLLAGLGFSWAIGFDFRFPEQLILPVYPMLWGGLGTAAQSVVASQEGIVALVLWLGFIVGSSLVYYLIFVSLNISNVATVRAVPLKQAAQSALFVSGLLMGVLGNFLLGQQLAGGGQLTLLIAMVVLLYIALAWPLLWVAQIKEGREAPTGLILASSWLVGWQGLQLALATEFLRLGLWERALIVSAALFLLIGFVQLVLDKSLSQRQTREFLGLGLGLLAVVVILSS